MRIVVLRAFADNYIFMLEHDSEPESAVIDPGDAGPVLDHLRKSGRRLTAILNTHHHNDHVGGIRELVQRFPGIPVSAGTADRGRIPCQTVWLEEGSEITVCGAKARVLVVPGHTRAHIAYLFDVGEMNTWDLFSGDTVFGGTIGNMFEGTPEVMFQSIRKIRALPPETRIWCSHEYTLQYVRESVQIDPDNEKLSQRLRKLEVGAFSGKPTVPLILKEECETNPFFRWDDVRLAARLGSAPGLPTFRRLCEIT